MTPNSRRMRRTRVASSSEELLSGHDLYNIQGETKAAYDSFVANHQKDAEGASISSDYNLLLLRQLSSNPIQEDEFLKVLEEFENSDESKTKKQMLSSGKRQRNELIMAYNRALIFQAAGESSKCAAICNEYLKDIISSKKKLSDGIAAVASRMALLLLESILGLFVGRNNGLEHERLGSPPATAIVEWLESLDAEQDPQLKFLLALYKSRVDLAQLDSAGKHVDSKIRSARKELKTAMEVFQHKLRPSFGADTGSVVSSANSEENMSMHGSLEHQQQPPPSSYVLQKFNQSALSLKANLEQLKGNTKKSLILCSEAQSAAKDDGSYDAIHSNNLAVVYETNHKRHLALHALTKGLRANSVDSAIFHEDGTVRPDAALNILHNAALCALQAKNYLSAYECMAACVSRSEIFSCRPRCWLRIAEACLGLFTELKRQKSTKFSKVEING